APFTALPVGREIRGHCFALTLSCSTPLAAVPHGGSPVLAASGVTPGQWSACLRAQGASA
ncbi:MAG: hypothetical protein P8Y94_11590, partial [Acidobacteriota bacterium]